MSVAFILNQGYNTINNVHHTFWDQEGDAIKNSSLTQALAVSTSVAAPSHVITGGTNPAQLFMSDPITLETDAPQFKAPILQAPSAELQEITELTPTAGITFLNDAHFTSGTGVDEIVRDIDGVGTLTCDTLKYTTLDPAIPSADVSQWATFGASANVNLNGNNLIDSSKFYVTIPQAISADIPSSNGTFEFGNSNTSSSAESVMSVFSARGQAGSVNGQIKTIASTRTGSQTYSSKAGCTSLISNGGDVQVGYAGSAGNIRLCYSGGTGGMTKALTLNNSGALAFNSSFIFGTETVGSFGTSGQIVQSNGSSAAPSWVNAPSASNWSTFDATSDVDLAGYRLTNSSTADEKIVYATSSTADPFAAMMVTKTASSATADDVTFIGSEIYPTSGTSTSFNIVTKNSGAIKKTDKYGDLPGSATFVSFNASANILSNDAGNSTIITYDTSRKGIEFNNYGCVAFDSVCNSGATPPTPGSFGTSGQVLQSNGSTVAPSWVSPAISGRYVLYVATNGLDSNAGDITHPKLTIQSAINTATALYPQQVVILIQPGVYTGNLSITRPNITLLGYAPSSNQNLLTQIVGNVSIACTASQDLYYSQIGIFNLQISGLITDTSSVVHTLNIEQCRLSNAGQVFAQTSSANNRTRLFRCVILQSTTNADVNPMLLFSSGDIYLNELDVTAKNNCNVIKFNGTAKCPTCAVCLFSSDTASPVAEPIILIAPTDGTNYPFVFTQSAFVYSSYAPKLAHPESAGICVSSALGRPYISVTYNSFALAGTNGSNYAIYDTGYNTATAGYYFYFSNNGGVNPAGINAVVPSLVDFGPQASVIYGHSTGAAQNKYTLSAVA